MKLTNFEIANMFTFLGNLAEEEMNVKTSYRIGKILKKLSTHHQDFEKARGELVEQYAEKDKDGNYIPPKDDEGNEVEGKIMLTDPKKYNQELLELGQDEIDISFNILLTMDDLEVLNKKFSVGQIMILDPIIKED